MNYEQMTIEDINERVSSYFPHLSHEYHTCGYEYVWNEETSREWDGCTNPEDAWPIMNDARIEIKRDTCQAHISSYFNPESVTHCRNDEEEILRAAMICFLKMKDAEK